MNAEILGVEFGECVDVFEPDNLVQHFHEFTPAWGVGVPPCPNLIVDVFKDMWQRET